MGKPWWVGFKTASYAYNMSWIISIVMVYLIIIYVWMAGGFCRRSFWGAPALLGVAFRVLASVAPQCFAFGLISGLGLDFGLAPSVFFGLACALSIYFGLGPSVFFRACVLRIYFGLAPSTQCGGWGWAFGARRGGVRRGWVRREWIRMAGGWRGRLG